MNQSIVGSTVDGVGPSIVLQADDASFCDSPIWSSITDAKELQLIAETKYICE